MRSLAATSAAARVVAAGNARTKFAASSRDVISVIVAIVASAERIVLAEVAEHVGARGRRVVLVKPVHELLHYLRVCDQVSVL